MVLGIVGVPAQAGAAEAGDLDQSFGVGGALSLPMQQPTDVLVVPDGRSFTLSVAQPSSTGGFEVSAFDANGTLDPAFGSGGRVVVAAPGFPTTMAFDPQGRILIAGDNYDSGYSLVTARLLPNGQLDSTYGSGGVSRLTNFGEVISRDVAVDAANRPILIDESGPSLEFIRLTSSGAPDPSFGTNGDAKILIGGSTDNVFGDGLALTPDGGIVGTGSMVHGSSGYEIGIAGKVTATGVPDPGFNGGDPSNTSGSIRSTSGPLGVEPQSYRAVAVQGDGKLVIGGYTRERVDFMVTRLLPDGRFDSTFGTGGVSRNYFGQATDVYTGDTLATDVALQPDGSIVLGGRAGTLNQGGPEGFAVARYLPDGTLDSAFGQGGEVLTHFPGKAAYGYQLGIDDGGRILLLGGWEQGGCCPPIATGTQLARYLGHHQDEPPSGGGGGGSTGGSSDGASGGVAGAFATSARNVHVHKVVVPRSRAALGSLGVRVLASCDEDCQIELEVAVSKSVAQAMGLRSTVLANGSVLAKAGEWHWVLAKLTPAARRALRSYRGAGRLHVNVTGISP
jgi:uncharacterized delta-60 repeat protein